MGDGDIHARARARGRRDRGGERAERTVSVGLGKRKERIFSRVASSVKRSPGASPRVPESPVTLGSPGDGGVGSKTRMMDALSARGAVTACRGS